MMKLWSRYLILLFCIIFSTINVTFAMQDDLSDIEWLKARKLRVIAAEDSEFFQKQLTRMLQGVVDQIEIVGNGRLLVEQFKQGFHTLILTDGDMPEMSGYEAVQNLRTKHAFSLPPIILISGDTIKERLNKFQEAGADGFVPKPFTKQVLMAEIRRCLQMKQTKGMIL